MSSALDTAIYRRLVGIETLSGSAATAQAALIVLLATDPDTGRAAVYNSSLNDAQLTVSGVKTQVFPCITFNQATGTPNRDVWNAGTIHEQVIYNFEVWNDARTALPIKTMCEYLDSLLDYRLGAVTQTTNPLVITNGFVDWCEEDIPVNFHYDRAIHAWAGLVRYAITMRRWLA